MSTQRIRWSHKSLDDLERFYWDEIAPELRREGRTPDEEYPSYRWLVEHGYSGLQKALRRDHDRTLPEFFEDDIGIPGDDSDGYDWGIDNERTIQALEGYLNDVAWHQAASTARTRRTHLRKYVATYSRLHGEADVIGPLADPDELEPEKQRVRATARAMREELSQRSTYKYLSDVEHWYREYVAEHFSTAFNPTRNLAARYEPEDDPDQPALSADQVRALYEAADTPTLELLVLGLAGWGLRRAEVASLHESQLVLDPDGDVPHLAFDERKNGPSTVSLVYGVEELRDRREVLVSEYDDWNGYLFPSGQSETGHISPTTVWRRFRRLGEQAGVTVDGELPEPHQGRRFWFREYQRAMHDVYELAEEIGGEQGSDDPRTVVQNYWSDQEVREHRRRYMERRLSEAFGADE